MMDTAATWNLVRWFGPLRLTGPLSDKELRVASRRVRNYALRGGYILLLAVLMLWGWYSTLGIRGPATAAFGVSRASEVSTQLTATIIWFQFVIAQALAAMMMSTSISEESRRGTLGVLLTTPITSTHIVVGKLLSGLLQVVWLLAISLPVLAILRVGGGVPWDFVAAGFCVTLVAALFSGALGLWLSTYYRQPCQAVSAVATAYFILFLVLPTAVMVLASLGVMPQAVGQLIIDLTNPFPALYRASLQFQQAGTTAPGGLPWPVHCVTLLGATLLIVCLSVRRVRWAAGGLLAGAERRFRPIERLQGSPLVWKDTGGRLLPRGWVDIAVAIIALGMCGFVIVGMMPGGAAYSYLHLLSSCLWFLALLRLTISAAGGITREKESGAWPILLTTPFENRQIILAKAAGALRQNAIVLLSAFAVQASIVFRMAGPSNASYIVLSAALLIASILLIVSAGLYFGVRLKNSGMAAAATLGIYLLLNYVVSRLVSTVVLRLLWSPIARVSGSSNTMLVLNIVAFGSIVVLNVAIAGFMVWRAHRNLRRYVF